MQYPIFLFVNLQVLVHLELVDGRAIECTTRAEPGSGSFPDPDMCI